MSGTKTITGATSAPPLDEAYAWCLALAQRHYENFPVASLLLPARLRHPVAVVYAFARIADDFADEEALLSETARLTALDDWERQLDASVEGEASHPVFVALAHVLRHHAVPVTLFKDLLSAFRQDVTTRSYADFAAVMDYCRRSADPVGRILLYLDGSASEENLRLSDCVCSSLQLINFWQDLAQDWDENRRLYLPRDEMARFGVSEDHLAQRKSDDALRALMTLQYQRTRALMLKGAPLGRRLRGRFGLEIRLIIEGGLRVLDYLESSPDPFARPRLRRTDLVRLFWRAL